MGKEIVCLSALFFLVAVSSNTSFGQATPTSIYTPNSTLVNEAYIVPEFSLSDIAFRNSWADTTYPLATRIADASDTYNCHGYAWHMTEGGSAVWIGLNAPGAESVYWEDDSYIEVCNASTFPAKVSFGPNADHSAITTGVSGIFLSKWAQGPLMEHDKDYSPFDSSDLRYYVRATSIITPSISGASLIADSASFSAVLPLGGASVVWTVSGDYAISGPDTSQTVNVYRTGAGSGLLTATLYTPCEVIPINKSLSALSLSLTPGGNGYCGEITASTNLPSGKNYLWEVSGDLLINNSGQSLSTSNNSILVTGTEGYISLKFLAFGDTITLGQNHKPYNPQLSINANPMYGSDPLSVTVTNLSAAIDYVEWYIDNAYLTTEYSLSLYEPDPPCSTHTLKAVIFLSCGSTVSVETEFERHCSWFRSLVIYPNPATTKLHISPDMMRNKGNVLSGEYEAVLYDRMGKKRISKRSDKQLIEIDVSSLPQDTYFLHVKKDGEKEILKRQIIVQR